MLQILTAANHSLYQIQGMCHQRSTKYCPETWGCVFFGEGSLVVTLFTHGNHGLSQEKAGKTRVCIYIYILFFFFLWGGGGGGGWYLLSVNVNLASSELGAKEVQTLQPITAELVWECLKKNRNCKLLQPFVLMTFID